MLTVFALLANRRRLGRAWLRQANWATAVVAAAFLVIVGMVVAGAYWFFLHAFEIVLADTLSGPIIATYVIEAAMALIFALGVMSFIVSSQSTLFAPDEMRFLATLPARPLSLFTYRFVDSSLVSSWPVFIIGIPAVLALGVNLRADFSFYAFGLLVLALFALFIAETGALLSFGLAAISSRLTRSWLWFAETLMFLGVLISLMRRIIPRSLFTVFFVYNPEQARTAWDRIAAIFGPIPSHLFAKVMSLALPGAPAADVWVIIGTVAGVMVAAAVALLGLAAVAYLPLWQSSEEGGFVAKPEDAPHRRLLPPFPRIFRNKHGFLIEREMLGLVRNSEEMSRASFLLALLFLYLLALGALGNMDEFSRGDLNSTMLAFAFVSIGYFALTFGMRFAFPSISLEGRAAWVLWSAPTHIHELFTAKLFFWAAAIGLPTALAALLGSILMGLAWPVVFLFVFAAVCVSATVAAVTIGQGAISPNFREKNSDALSTSPAGLAATAIGLAYLLIVGRYVKRFAAAFLTSGRIDVASLFGVLVVSIAIVGAYWIAAPRAMERAEIP